MYSELYEKSGSDIIRELGKQYSNYRKRMKYTQKQVAEKSGLSVFTISSFENGSSTGITVVKELLFYDNFSVFSVLIKRALSLLTKFIQWTLISG